MRIIERRKGMMEEAKMVVQRNVTYIIFALLGGTVANVLLGIDQAERSTILQTIVNLAFLAAGFWLGNKVAEVNAGGKAAPPTVEAPQPPTTQGKE